MGHGGYEVLTPGAIDQLWHRSNRAHMCAGSSKVVRRYSWRSIEPLKDTLVSADDVRRRGTPTVRTAGRRTPKPTAISDHGQPARADASDHEVQWP